MLLRIRRRPEGSIDGVAIARYRVGLIYEIGTQVASVLLAEGWAEPVPSDEPVLAIPLSEADLVLDPLPRNLSREADPPRHDGHFWNGRPLQRVVFHIPLHLPRKTCERTPGRSRIPLQEESRCGTPELIANYCLAQIRN